MQHITRTERVILGSITTLRLNGKLDAMVERFYEIFFELAPASRAMFPADLRNQRRSLASVFVMLAETLNGRGKQTFHVGRIAGSHRKFAIQPELYAVMAEALIQAINETLPAPLTQPEERSWLVLYWRLAVRLLDPDCADQPLCPCSSSGT